MTDSFSSYANTASADSNEKNYIILGFINLLKLTEVLL